MLPLLLALLLGLAPSASIGFLAAGGFGVIYLGANYLLFSRYFLDLTIITPLMAFGLSTLSSEIYRSLVVDRKGRYMKKAFSNYV